MKLELNHLNINSFVLEIEKIPILKYSIQSMTFPSVSLPDVKHYNPFQTINQVGDHIEHDEFSFSFLVDEKMFNYKALYFWIKGIAFPNSYSEFKDFISGISKDENIIPRIGPDKLLNQFSDVNVFILSNHKNPILKYKFFDAFPVSLSGFDIDITSSTTQPISSTCSMKFTGFEIENLS